MTCLEKYMEDYKDDPERLSENELFNGEACPNDFGYALFDARYCNYDHIDCIKCWNREVEEKKEDVVDKLNEVGNVNAISAEELKNATYEIKYPTIGKKALEIQEKLYKDMGIIGDPVGDAVTKILDSGNRREFETGAVRDIQEGKGRCDLLPLDVVADLMDETDIYIIGVLMGIHSFTTRNDVRLLHTVIYNFCNQRGWNKHTMLLEVSKHFEEGAKKYGENNWQKGIPTHCYIDSAVRHYLKYLRGDKDEPHDRAFAWNILCCIWTCIHKPELNDYAKKVEE